MTNRGKVVYQTLDHAARCEDCHWLGMRVDENTPKRLVHARNANAARHARVHRHRVIVVITRVFDRRANA